MKGRVRILREVIFEQLVLRSADGKTPLAGYIWRAEGEAPRAIIQLSHGMCEYINSKYPRTETFVIEGGQHVYSYSIIAE